MDAFIRVCLLAPLAVISLLVQRSQSETRERLLGKTLAACNFRRSALFVSTCLPAYNGVMARELVWLDQPRFRGWGCSYCAWVFNPPGPPIGETFDAMMRNYKAQRDKARETP